MMFRHIFVKRKKSQNINKIYIKSHIKDYLTKHVNVYKNVKFILKVMDWSYYIPSS